MGKNLIRRKDGARQAGGVDRWCDTMKVGMGGSWTSCIHTQGVPSIFMLSLLRECFRVNIRSLFVYCG